MINIKSGLISGEVRDLIGVAEGRTTICNIIIGQMSDVSDVEGEESVVIQAVIFEKMDVASVFVGDITLRDNNIRKWTLLSVYLSSVCW